MFIIRARTKGEKRLRTYVKSVDLCKFLIERAKRIEFDRWQLTSVSSTMRTKRRDVSQPFQQTDVSLTALLSGPSLVWCGYRALLLDEVQCKQKHKISLGKLWNDYKQGSGLSAKLFTNICSLAGMLLWCNVTNLTALTLGLSETWWRRRRSPPDEQTMTRNDQLASCNKREKPRSSGQIDTF